MNTTPGGQQSNYAENAPWAFKRADLTNQERHSRAVESQNNRMNYPEKNPPTVRMASAKIH
jgi:hypothetical protein